MRDCRSSYLQSFWKASHFDLILLLDVNVVQKAIVNYYEAGLRRDPAYCTVRWQKPKQHLHGQRHHSTTAPVQLSYPSICLYKYFYGTKSEQ